MAGKKVKTIAIYGKGGIGKSTTTSNISAALAASLALGELRAAEPAAAPDASWPEPPPVKIYKL